MFDLILTYSDAVVHDGAVLVLDAVRVDAAWVHLVEPDPPLRLHVAVDDVDVAVSLGELVLVGQTNGVTDLVKVQAFLETQNHEENNHNSLLDFIYRPF